MKAALLLLIAAVVVAVSGCDAARSGCEAVEEAERAPGQWYLDGDGDGFGESSSAVFSCRILSDRVPEGGDCDDTDAEIHPDAEEICDNRDNDCNGQLGNDELIDLDGDGFTVCQGDCDDNDFFQSPGDNDGDGVTGCDGDCDDFDPLVFPGAEITCDTFQDDSNCDGISDGQWDDLDGDGFAFCSGDCDDGNAAVHPSLPELCDGIDNDCDDGTSEDDDLDGDGLTLCEDDCDDADPDVYPGAAESCDAIDQNCDGEVGDAVDDASAIAVPGDCPTILGALQTADAAAVVTVAPGVYEEIVVLTGRPVHLVSEGGPTVTTIDGGGAGPVLQVIAGEGEDTVVEGFTITGGDAPSGGGVWVAGSSPTLRHLHVVDNTATAAAAGFRVSGSSLVLEDSIVSNNVVSSETSATLRGGGMHIDGGATVTLRRVVIADNRVENSGLGGAEGGGIWAQGFGDPLVLSHVILSGNVTDAPSSLARGGALASSRSLTVTRSVLVGNSATGAFGYGGAVWQDTGVTEISNSVFAFNTADTTGGGMYSDVGESFDLPACGWWDNEPEDVPAIVDLMSFPGTILDDPAFEDVTSPDPTQWDVHLGVDSPMVDVGALEADPDGSSSDLGVYGGTEGSQWDLDADGDPEWWQPGPYDAALYPGEGWDCDDRDATAGPDAGCDP